MKSSATVGWLVAVVLAVPTSLAVAQEENQEGQLVRIVEYFVEPGKTADFEEGRKKTVGVFAEQGFKYLAQISVSEEGVYRDVQVLGDWQDVANRQQQFSAMLEKGQLPGTPHQSRRSSILRAHPDLSYLPENPRAGVSGDDFGFIHYVFIHLRAGTRPEALEVLSKGTALLRKHGIRDNVIVTASVVAHDEPFVLLRFHAANAAAYYRNWEENRRVLGDEFAALVKQLQALARHIEISNNTLRRDLSYQPSSQTN